MFALATSQFISNSVTRKSLRYVLVLLAVFAFSRIVAGNVQSDINASPSDSGPGRVTNKEQTEQAITTLEQGKPIASELAGVQQHNYQITLVEGQYASLIVEQRGIDVIVQLFGTNGKSIDSFDGEIRTEGEEKVEVLAETSGSYRLVVRMKYPKLPAGRYEIRLIEVRDATENDRLLYEGNELETASGRLASAGKYDEAIPVEEKALELQERRLGAKHPDLTYPLHSLAMLDYFKGDFAKAVALCQRAVTIAETSLGSEHWRVGRLLHSLAIFYNAAADSASAEPRFQRAISILEKALGPDHPLIATSLSELAVLYRKKGDFVHAEPLLQRALTIHEKTLGEEHNSLASTLNSLAALYREKGDYAEAEPLYQRALVIREKTNHPYLAVALNNLANLYSDMGDYDRAEPLYQRSISLKEKSVGPNHGEVANSRSNIAFIYYKRGDYAKAETLYLNALATMEKALGPNHPTFGAKLSALANVYFATKDYAKAEPLYNRSLSILETANGAFYYYLADILFNLATISAVEGKLAQATAYQSRANAIIEHNLDLNLVVGSERQKLAYLAKLPEQMNQAISLHARFAADDPKALELAITTVLERKGRVQDALSNSLTSLRSRFSAEDRALLDQLNDITSQLARLALNEPQGISLAEHQKQIKALAEQREKLEIEISRRSAEFYVRSQPVTLADIRSVIPDDAALIELVVYNPFDPTASEVYGAPRYVAYVMRKEGEVRWKDLGDAKAIDGAIEEFRKALRDPKRQDVQQLARAVDEKTMQPVRALIGDATQLLISPDGALNLIPFEALVDEQNRYLVERFSCTYLTSGRDLLRLQLPRASKSVALVLADPMFGEPEIAQVATAHSNVELAALGRKRPSVTTRGDLTRIYFASLGGTAKEAHAIKSLFPEASVLMGLQATDSALKRVVAPRILHIATHGFFLQDANSTTDSVSNTNAGRTRGINARVKIENPLLRSGLALAGANLSNRSNDDGILTALEASGLNLWGTKLVTLSACDTGVGEVKNGEGVYGLRRAFVLAGVETLVMSLWPISDYVTREMMAGYYKGLKQGQGRGEAMRHLQINMIKRKGREHPFYWASFIQLGEWANLDGKR